jgi:hypothetical protein
MGGADASHMTQASKDSSVRAAWRTESRKHSIGAVRLRVVARWPHVALSAILYG